MPCWRSCSTSTQSYSRGDTRQNSEHSKESLARQRQYQCQSMRWQRCACDTRCRQSYLLPKIQRREVRYKTHEQRTEYMYCATSTPGDKEGEKKAEHGTLNEHGQIKDSTVSDCANSGHPHAHAGASNKKTHSVNERCSKGKKRTRIQSP